MSSYAQSIFIYVYNPVPVCVQPFIFHAAFYSAFYREAIQNVQCFKSMTSTKKHQIVHRQRDRPFCARILNEKNAFSSLRPRPTVVSES